MAFAEGSLDPARHWYPAGYPLLGAPFAQVLPLHPFLVPNLLCFVGIVVTLHQLFRRLVSEVEAILLVAAGVFGVGAVAQSLAVPWSTIPTHLGTYVVIVLLTWGPHDLRRYAAAGAVCGLVFWCRPSDVAFLFPVFAAAALWTRDWRQIGWAVAYSAAGFVPFLLGFLAINLVIYDTPWSTPYVEVLDRIGLSVSGFLPKAWLLLVDVETVHGSDRGSWLGHFPWLLLVLPGAVHSVRALDRRQIGVLAAIAGAYAVYIAYDDFDASNAFKYRLTHYLAWTLPLLLGMSWLTVTRAWTTLSPRLYGALLLGPLAVLGAVGFSERQVVWNGTVDFRVGPATTRRSGSGMAWWCGSTTP